MLDNATYRKTARHIVWPLLLAYIIAYLDRVNVGFAKLQMLSALHFDETVYGFGAGVFFLGYFLCGIPANLLLRRIGARRGLAAIMVSWGIVSSATMCVTTPAQFYLLRFLLGVAEAGFFPGVIFHLAHWFPENRRAGVTAFFMTAIAICGALGSVLSGWIMQSFEGQRGWLGWQWLFILEGLPAVIVGIFLLRFFNDRPAGASWLSASEKALLAATLSRETQAVPATSVKDTLRSPRLWLISLIYFCMVTGVYGITFWLPTMLRDLGVQEPLTIGELTAIPYAVAAIGMVLVGRSADRKREYRWHIVLPATLGSAGLILSTALSGHLLLTVAALTVATWGILAAPPLVWSLPAASKLRGAAAASGIGLINSMGNLAGFASPYAVGWLKDLTGSTTSGMKLVAGLVLGGACLVALFVTRPIEQRPVHLSPAP